MAAASQIRADVGCPGRCIPLFANSGSRVVRSSFENIDGDLDNLDGWRFWANHREMGKAAPILSLV